jgi:hypothetical protein
MPQFTKEHLDKALDRHFKKIDQRFEKLVKPSEISIAQSITSSLKLNWLSKPKHSPNRMKR